MAVATDQQMQAFCDQRLRPFAEAARALLVAAEDDSAAIGSEYARATSASAWADARTDGPPTLLQSGNSANPDDLLNFNAWIVAFVAIINGTNTAQDAANAATLRANWAVLMRACVQPVSP
jgi:hypothetical protein